VVASQQAWPHPLAASCRPVLAKAGRFFDNNSIMAWPVLLPFRCPATHKTVSCIIRGRSSNSADVRDIALDGLNLSSCKDILDLGCGFGFMSEALAKRAAGDAHITGVDAWHSNEAEFTKKVAATGCRASFVCAKVVRELAFPDRSFDVVSCSYSLYFFVDVLPEIARVLRPDGLLIALTHTEGSARSLLQIAAVPEEESDLLCLLQRFSTETGDSVLSEFFHDIRRVDYDNSLVFAADDVDELLMLLKFKLPLLVPGSTSDDELPERIVRNARAALSRSGEVVIEKNDTVFRCRDPICH